MKNMLKICYYVLGLKSVHLVGTGFIPAMAKKWSKLTER